MNNELLYLRQEATERAIIDVDITKVDHQAEANKLISPLTEGWINPAEMYAKIRHLKEIVEIAEDMIKDNVVDYMATNYGKESLNIAGMEIKYKSGAGRWTYPNNFAIESVKNRLKSLEKIAQALANTNCKPVADTETGELIYPAVFVPNKDTIEVKFK